MTTDTKLPDELERDPSRLYRGPNCPQCGSDNTERLAGEEVECRPCGNVWDSPFIISARDRRRQECSEVLDMLASQLREALGDKRNHMPSPSRFDDWLAVYRREYLETNDTPP